MKRCKRLYGNMSERHRALPAWMEKKEVKEKAPLKNLDLLKTQKKRKAARAAFYCMNEAEMVEAAVSYLTNGACEDVTLPIHQQTVKQAKDDTAIKQRSGASRMKAKLMTKALEEETSDCCSDLEATYVSETDVDITEAETLPFIKSLQHPKSENEKSAAAQDDPKLMNIASEAEKEKKKLQIPEEEVVNDDSLQLVREIFFN